MFNRRSRRRSPGCEKRPQSSPKKRFRTLSSQDRSGPLRLWAGTRSGSAPIRGRARARTIWAAGLWSFRQPSRTSALRLCKVIPFHREFQCELLFRLHVYARWSAFARFHSVVGPGLTNNYKLATYLLDEHPAPPPTLPFLQLTYAPFISRVCFSRHRTVSRRSAPHPAPPCAAPLKPAAPVQKDR